MSVRSAIQAGRRAAERRMGAANGGSDVAIRRKTGRTKVDGFDVPAWTTIHATLPARIGGFWGSGPQRQSNVGAADPTSIGTRTLHLPAGTAPLKDEDHVEVLSGENAGIFFRIIETDWQDQATAYRLPVESVERPEGWAS